MKNRRSIRLPEYDYSSPGAYFVTISTHEKKLLFGSLIGEEVALSEWGKIAEKCWQEIPKHFAHVELDEFIIMPNHVRGILWIIDLNSTKLAVRATHASPLRQPRSARGPAPSSLAAIIGSYKSAVSRAINRLGNSSKFQIWQRNYYERVIRDDRELDAIRNYITHNAIKDFPVPI